MFIGNNNNNSNNNDDDDDDDNDTDNVNDNDNDNVIDNVNVNDNNDDDDDDDEHQTDTACSWLVCHSATVGGTVWGNTVQIVSTYPASPEARPPSFLGKPAVRPHNMAGGAPTPCGRH